MKNSVVNAVAVLATSLFVVSCQKEKETSAVDPGMMEKITVAVNASDPTVKSSLEMDRGLEKRMLLAVTGAGTTVLASSDEAGNRGVFSFCLSPGRADSYLYQAIYPASAVKEGGKWTSLSAKVTLPSVQHPLENAVDPEANIMLAVPEKFNSVVSHWTASMRSAVATNCLTLQGLPSGKYFQRVEIIAPAGVSLSGDCEMNLSTGACDFVSESSRTVEVEYATGVPGGNDIPVWFTSWDAELGEGDAFTIIAYSTDKYSYTKEVVIPAFQHLEAGVVKTASVSMSGIAGVRYYFSGGRGTEFSPWRIENISDLTEMASKVSAGTGSFGTDFYRQAADINFDGAYLNAIGNTNTDNNAHCFKGNYQGNGYRILNAAIRNQQSKKAVGFFGYLAGCARVDGLCLENCTVAGPGTWNVGAVVGCIQGSSQVVVENCMVTGTTVSASKNVQGGYHVGGICGRQMSGIIRDCRFSGRVQAVGNNKAGGIVGNLSGGRILYCTVDGRLLTTVESAYDYAGGIAGYVDQNGGLIENCTVQCKEIKGTRGKLGGIVGGWTDVPGTVNRCSAECDVVNNSSGNYGCLGGIVGWIEDGASKVLVVNACFSGGSLRNVNGTGGGVAGIVGQVSSTDLNKKIIFNCCAFPSVVSTGSGNANIAGIAGRVANATIRNCYCPAPSSSFLFNGSASGASRGGIYGWLTTGGEMTDVYWLNGFSAGNYNGSCVYVRHEQSLTVNQMRNQSPVIRPSTEQAYNCFIDALNAGAASWNEEPGQQVYASGWEMHEGYPVPIGTAVPVVHHLALVQGETLLDLCDRKIAEYGMNSVVANHIYLCAHRANTYWSKQHGIPENSLPAIKKAIELGVDMVELDVRETSDGHLIIMHDKEANTTTDSNVNDISSLTLQQVKALRMHPRGSSQYPLVNGDYVRVPTLEEVLDLCRGKVLVNLDIKKNGNDIEPSRENVLNAILSTGTRDQVMIFGTGNKWHYMRDGRVLLGGPLAIHPYINTTDDVDYYLENYFGSAKLFQYGYTLYYNSGSPDFGKLCHAKGVLSYSNSLNKDGEIITWYNNGTPLSSCKVLDRFMASGSDFLQTDYYELADLYYRSKNVR